MKYFSGFSMTNESYLFDKYIKTSPYSVCGFSYGAIKAFNYAKEQLKHGNRVDTLQLFSPAFFQTKDTKFKRLQVMSYKKNKILYLQNFMNSCFCPYAKKIVEHRNTTIDELEKLLNYNWDMSELIKIKNMGVNIEVYLAQNDNIIDIDGAREFFLEISTVTYIKNANHFLQTT
ncbi:MAG: pimelyl-ACP methyl ester esterase BioV [Sulfurimonas sp.]|nr:pimelyl-ACP methyl ester esterase BioV [Sulfurimonas sp.]